MALKAGETTVFFTLDHRRCCSPISTRVGNGPTRKRTGDFDNVLLRVASVNAKGVQFHQFACIVFIKAATGAILLLLQSLDPLIEFGVRQILIPLDLLPKSRRYIAASNSFR